MIKFIYLILVVFLLSTQSASAQILGGSQNHDSTKPIDIESDKLILRPEKNKARFLHNVIATQDEMILEAQEMVVYYHKDGKNEGKTSTLSKVEAKHGLTISVPGKTATADRGVYDVDKSIVILLGDVILTRGSTELEGDKFIYNVNTGKSQLINDSVASDNSSKKRKRKRVRAKFIPKQNPIIKNPATKKSHMLPKIANDREKPLPKPISKPNDL